MFHYLRNSKRLKIGNLFNYSIRRLEVTTVKTSTADTSNPKSQIDYNQIKFPTKVPQKPHSFKFNSCRTSIDEETIKLLERISLVNLDSKEALQTLEDSIEFASKILDIDTTDIEPLYSVLEAHPLRLRPDKVTDGNIQSEILRNAKVTEEEYFIAPPGNIPLEQTTKKFD